jgi:hypothetical protein
MVACGDAGVSYQEKHHNSPVTKAFQSIADQLIAASTPKG